MRLIDLNPKWIVREWHCQSPVGIDFKCIHCEERVVIFFANPPCGAKAGGEGLFRWTLNSWCTFDQLSLYPSIDWTGHMHVSIDKGNVIISK